MEKINRETKYEIIKKLINRADADTINKYVSELWTSDDLGNVEDRREELLSYLTEVNEFWKEHNIDVTDRQNIEVVESKDDTEVLEQHKSDLKEITKKVVDTAFDIDLPRLPQDEKLLKGLSHIDHLMFMMSELPANSFEVEEIFYRISQDLEKLGNVNVIANIVLACLISTDEDKFDKNVERLNNYLIGNEEEQDTVNYCMSIIDLYNEYFPKKDSRKIKKIRRKIKNN